MGTVLFFLNSHLGELRKLRKIRTVPLLSPYYKKGKRSQNEQRDRFNSTSQA